jgi:hypothetical protein
MAATQMCSSNRHRYFGDNKLCLTLVGGAPSDRAGHHGCRCRAGRTCSCGSRERRGATVSGAGGASCASGHLLPCRCCFASFQHAHHARKPEITRCMLHATVHEHSYVWLRACSIPRCTAAMQQLRAERDVWFAARDAHLVRSCAAQASATKQVPKSRTTGGCSRSSIFCFSASSPQVLGIGHQRTINIVVIAAVPAV